MEQPNHNEHIVDMPTTSSNGSNNRNSSSTRRALVVPGHEHPRAPLFAWIVGYASGCVASIPLYYWRHQVSELELAQGFTRISLLGVSHIRRNPEVEELRASPTSGQTSVASNARLWTLVECSKIAFSCFFDIWFVVGIVWTFRGHSSASDAPIMYRFCVVFLTLSFIGYAMFILCVTAEIFCSIISHLCVREDLTQTRGSTAELISALPTYKFKLNKKTKRLSVIDQIRL